MGLQHTSQSSTYVCWRTDGSSTIEISSPQCGQAKECSIYEILSYEHRRGFSFYDLLFVVLDDLGSTYFRLVRVIPKFAECPTLAQEIPVLVKLDLQLSQATPVTCQRTVARSLRAEGQGLDAGILWLRQKRYPRSRFSARPRSKSLKARGFSHRGCHSTRSSAWKQSRRYRSESWSIE
jgi:hypothetical protein